MNDFALLCSLLDSGTKGDGENFTIETQVQMYDDLRVHYVDALSKTVQISGLGILEYLPPSYVSFLSTNLNPALKNLINTLNTRIVYMHSDLTRMQSLQKNRELWGGTLYSQVQYKGRLILLSNYKTKYTLIQLVRSISVAEVSICTRRPRKVKVNNCRILGLSTVICDRTILTLRFRDVDSYRGEDVQGLRVFLCSIWGNLVIRVETDTHQVAKLGHVELGSLFRL